MDRWNRCVVSNWNTGYHRDGKGVVMKMSGNSDNGKRQTNNSTVSCGSFAIVQKDHDLKSLSNVS